MKAIESYGTIAPVRSESLEKVTVEEKLYDSAVKVTLLEHDAHIDVLYKPLSLISAGENLGIADLTIPTFDLIIPNFEPPQRIPVPVLNGEMGNIIDDLNLKASEHLGEKRFNLDIEHTVEEYKKEIKQSNHLLALYRAYFIGKEIQTLNEDHKFSTPIVRNQGIQTDIKHAGLKLEDENIQTKEVSLSKIEAKSELIITEITDNEIKLPKLNAMYGTSLHVVVKNEASTTRNSNIAISYVLLDSSYKNIKKTSEQKIIVKEEEIKYKKLTQERSTLVEKLNKMPKTIWDEPLNYSEELYNIALKNYQLKDKIPIDILSGSKGQEAKDEALRIKEKAEQDFIQMDCLRKLKFNSKKPNPEYKNLKDQINKRTITLSEIKNKKPSLYGQALDVKGKEYSVQTYNKVKTTSSMNTPSYA